MSRESAVSAIERGDLSELQHVLKESEWDIGSEPLDRKGQTALHIACANGHLDIVQYLVKKGCSVTVEDVYGHTPLMLSFINKHWKVANSLLQITPNSALNELEGTLTSYNKSIVMQVAEETLATSCKEGYFELVKYLIKSGWCTVNHNDIIKLARCFDNLHIVKYLLTHCHCTMPDDMSEVHIACIQGVAETVKTALDSNGSSLLGTADDFGTTPIHYATLEPNVLRMIVQYAGEMLLNITDRMGNTPLHHSIKYECIESVTILVGTPGCDVNLANNKGETPLIAACKYNNIDVLQFCLASEKCDLNICDSERNTALHIVISGDSSCRLEYVQCLLQGDKCDPNAINKSGSTPLHIVCHRGDIPFLKALVADKRCDLNIQDGNGDTALHIGVENVEVVKCLLESGRSRCDIYNEEGLTPFHKAITNGVMASVEIMLKNGVNILQTTNDEFQNASIHIACVYYRRHILKFFLCHTNCDPNQQNAVGDTALHIVCKTGRDLQLQCILQSDRCDPNVINKSGSTPLHIVCHRGAVPLLKALVADKRCDLNIQDGNGDTALHIGVENVEVVKCLLESGRSRCDIYNEEGLTPFHKAITNGVMASVEIMLKNGVNILKNSNDEFQNASIHIACVYYRRHILKFFLCHTNCDPNQQNAVGDTALHIVCKTGRDLELQCILQSDRCDPNVINKSGSTPLHIVCHRGVVPLLKALVTDKRCDLNIQDGNGDTALHIGVENVEVVKCLLESGRIRCDIYNEEGLTPFHKAISNGVMASVEVMLKNGVNILQTSNDKFQDAPIHFACIYSRLDILKVLLSCESCDPNQQNAEGDTALHIVCRMRTGNELQFFELLTSTPGINSTLVNHEGIAPCDVVGNDSNTLLHIACAEGNTVIVELLLNNGADILKPDRHGDAPIHIACRFGRLSTLKILLGCTKSDPNQQNAEGDTALHIVCRMRTGRELQFLELLISTPEINPTLVNSEGIAPFEVVDSDGNTLLYMACAEGNTSVAELLVKNGADVLKFNRCGDAPIHVACKHSRLEILKPLFTSSNCNPDQLNADGDTALHIMSRKGGSSEQRNKISKIVEFLVNNGADILKPDRNEDAPIHIACRFGTLSTLKVLLGCINCDPNQQNAEGDTALHIVCRMRTGRELQFLALLTSTPGINPTLVNHEGIAPCDVVGNDGNTLLHIACAEGNTVIVELLLNNGADILKPDRHGDAPVHIACRFVRPSTLKVLLGCTNCDPNQQNAEGDTALHIVCRMRTGRELQFLELLISTPEINPTLVNSEGIAPFEVVDSDGNTLLYMACAEGNTSVAELLVKNGADVLKFNRCGDAPIHVACKHSRLEILKPLFTSSNCNPDQLNADGDTALHIMSRKGGSSEQRNKISKIVEFLVNNGADILKPDRNEDAPIHIACRFGTLSTLKVLLGCTNCDPNQQNAEGDTALHIVCRMRTGRELQFLELLISTPEINPTLVNHEGIGPFDVVGNDGNTLLHNACAEGNAALVEFLMKKGVDIQKSNGQGDAPIHIACKCFQLNSLKAILGSKDCNPNQQNAEGDTALHIVRRMRTGSEIQFLELLISTPGINPTIVNHEGIIPFEVVGNDGNTLLHNACAEGNAALVEFLMKKGVDIQKSNGQGDAPIHVACKHSRLEVLKALFTSSNCNPDQLNADEDTALHIVSRKGGSSEQRNKISKIVEFLVNNGADILKPDRYGDAPIHTTCQLSRLDILKILLESRDYNPNQQNGSGDTAMHIVCRNSRGSKLPFLKMLLSTPGINPEIVNHEGHTPIEVAGTNYFAIDAIKKFLEHKKSSIQAYLKIFVVGNSGNGKSTLIKVVTTEASQLRKYAPLSKMKYVNPSDVPPHTAGIVPIPFKSKHFGNAVLYDFAGQHEYYSSHAAVMENLILPSPPLFLLLIDISKSKEVIRKELVYWWHFINNQSQKAAAPPHVILAGSHKDMVKSRDREELETMIRQCVKCIAVMFKFVGYFPLDCRKLVSPDLSALLNELNTTCQTLRQIVDANLHCHILNALLRAPEFQDAGYCETIHIMNRIESDDALLPKNVSQLIPLLASLNDQGHILLLQNHTDESKSWVILKPDVLFSEVNGRIFAPKYFKGHSEFAISTISCKSTGVVTLSKLKEKFTEYSHEVIVAYLTHLEFCFRIKDKHILAMITKYAVHESAITEEYYFFPALVNVENPTDVCQPHQSIDYEYGWIYKCSRETEQLTTRFLHVLILRLAFACDPSDDPTETESVVLLRSCSVWKHGIAWWTNDGIEVIVEVGLQCHWVAVMMRCPDVKKVECAELRSKVIQTILRAKTDFCPAIAMTEYLIAPSSLKYPFEGRELTLYSMREVARATIEGKDYARDTEGKNPITIPQLLPFEPYHNMGDLVPKFFSGDTSVPVTPEELMQLAGKCHDKLPELKTAFKPDIGSFQRKCAKADCTEVERCVALFHILQRRGRFKTWRDFQQEFNRFSVFCEQSPLVRITIFPRIVRGNILFVYVEKSWKIF